MIFLQKIESVAILTALLVAYYILGFSWLWFAVLLLAPDVFMVGYLRNPKIGAVVYNLGHSYLFPILLLGVSMFYNFNFGIMFSVIWATHVAMDRSLGFGLKLPTGFKDTHLGTL